MKAKRIYSLILNGIRDPCGAFFYLICGREEYRLRHRTKLLLNVINDSYREVENYYKSITNDKEFLDHISTKISKDFFGQMDGCSDLYTLVRILRPKVVVETGVAAGVSSAFILKALNDNNKGILYSIDLPNYNYFDYLSKPEIVHVKDQLEGELIPISNLPKEGSGFVIPEDLKDRWVLKIGKSKDLLSNLLKEIGYVDIFLHDSEHSYGNMMFEFFTSWKYLTEGGLILGHDINWNNSFKDFSKEVNRKIVNLEFSGLGVIRK